VLNGLSSLAHADGHARHVDVRQLSQAYDDVVAEAADMVREIEGTPDGGSSGGD
jgi:hypothetical protein